MTLYRSFGRQTHSSFLYFSRKDLQRSARREKQEWNRCPGGIGKNQSQQAWGQKPGQVHPCYGTAYAGRKNSGLHKKTFSILNWPEWRGKMPEIWPGQSCLSGFLYIGKTKTGSFRYLWLLKGANEAKLAQNKNAARLFLRQDSLDPKLRSGLTRTGSQWPKRIRKGRFLWTRFAEDFISAEIFKENLSYQWFLNWTIKARIHESSKVSWEYSSIHRLTMKETSKKIYSASPLFILPYIYQPQKAKREQGETILACPMAEDQPAANGFEAESVSLELFSNKADDLPIFSFKNAMEMNLQTVPLWSLLIILQIRTGKLNLNGTAGPNWPLPYTACLKLNQTLQRLSIRNWMALGALNRVFTWN